MNHDNLDRWITKHLWLYLWPYHFVIHRNRGENRGTVCEVRVICVDVGQLNCHQVFYLHCKEDTELNFLRLFILLLNDILKVMETVWLYSYDEKKSGYHFVRWGKSSKEKISHHFDYSIMKLWKSLHFHYLQKNGITRLKTTNYVDDNPLHPNLSVNILHTVL